jgi:hypothetical protein
MVDEKNEGLNKIFENYQRSKNKKETAESLTKIYEESMRSKNIHTHKIYAYC